MIDDIKSLMNAMNFNVGVNFIGTVDFYSDLLFISFVKNGDCYLVKYTLDENNKTVESNDLYVYMDCEWILCGNANTEEEDDINYDRY